MKRTYFIKACFLPAAAFPYKELAEGYKDADEVLDDDVWPLDSFNDCKKILFYKTELVKLIEKFHLAIFTYF